MHFIQSARQRSQQQAARVAPTMMGFTLGRGRVVVAADADVFRTDAMRDCLTGLDVAAVRALEFLREGGTVSRSFWIVFDEYHQAFGAQPGTISAVALYLRNSPSGHLLTQLTFAGLVLLVAFAPASWPRGSSSASSGGLHWNTWMPWPGHTPRSAPPAPSRNACSAGYAVG